MRAVRQAEAVWRVVAAEREMDFAVVHLDSPEGQWIVNRWRLRTVPALVIDDKLVAIGVQESVEFSLQIPANAVLFAVVLGLALHPPPLTTPRNN